DPCLWRRAFAAKAGPAAAQRGPPLPVRRRPRRARRSRALPTIEDVGRLLLVLTSIRESQRAEAARFVKAPRPRIRLEAPKLERRSLPFGRLEQQRARAAADEIRVDVEQADLVATEREKSGDAAPALGDYDLAFGQDLLGDEGAVFLGR